MSKPSCSSIPRAASMKGTGPQRYTLRLFRSGTNWVKSSGETRPVAPLADLTADELAAEAGEVTLHQLQLVRENQIVWGSREMEELDVRVWCRVGQPTRHCHDRSNAAATRNEEVG